MSNPTQTHTVASDDPTPTICVTCAKAPALKEFIVRHGSTGRTCLLCRCQEAVALDLGAIPHARQLIKALVRIHFAEWEYDSYHGGDSFESLLARENPIITHDGLARPLTSDDDVDAGGVLAELFWPVNEPPDQGVSLYGHGFHRLFEREPSLLGRWRHLLHTENHFALEGEVAAALDPYRSVVETALAAGAQFIRARKGVAERFRYAMDLNRTLNAVPFSGDAIGAPPPTRATAGRINRHGVAFLYLASDVATAIAEVRPHPGDLVSIGHFRLTRAQRIADFTGISLLDFFHTDDRLAEYAFLMGIDRELSAPVVPEERDRYVLGQLLADVLRQMGFEGLRYRSSLTGGENIALFDPRAATYIEAGAVVSRIDSARYTSSDVPSALAIDRDDPGIERLGNE